MKIYTYVLVGGLLASAMLSPALASATTTTATQVTVQVAGSSSQKLQCRAFQKEDRMFLLTGGGVEVFGQTPSSKKDGPAGAIDFTSSSVRLLRSGDRLFIMSAGRILQFDRKIGE